MSSIRTRSGRWGAVADWIIDAIEGDMMALGVYVVLVSRYADINGDIVNPPTQAQIAKDLHVSPASVKRGMQRLREIGVIATERSKRISLPGQSAFDIMLDDTHPDRR